VAIFRSPNPNQVSYGEAIGIILLKTQTPAIPGDVANATSFSYPVRYIVVEDASIRLIFTDPRSVLNQFIGAAKTLESEGVMAITGDCGFMAALQREVADSVNVPVFMSSLLQIPIVLKMLRRKQKLGMITANSRALTRMHFEGVGITDEEIDRLIIGGMEHRKHFKESFLAESSEFDPELIEEEVVSLGLEMLSKEPEIGAFLVECSVLPPYSPALQSATRLPVFDFLTLIDFVHTAVVKTDKVFYL